MFLCHNNFSSTFPVLPPQQRNYTRCKMQHFSIFINFGNRNDELIYSQNQRDFHVEKLLAKLSSTSIVIVEIHAHT